VNLDAPYFSTVGDVKDMVFNQEAIPQDQQRLIFKGKELHDNNQLLLTLNPHYGQTFHLLVAKPGALKIQMPNVQYGGIRAQMEVCFRDHFKHQDIGVGLTIQNFHLQTKNDLKNHYHNLSRKYHPDQNKNNPNALPLYVQKFQDMKDCHDLLLSVVDKIHITVKTLTGKKVGIDAYLYNHVKDVKEMIYEKEGIPPHMQSLLYLGARLDEEDKELQEIYIVDGSVMHLNLR
jgi:ubiquitin C